MPLYFSPQWGKNAAYMTRPPGRALIGESLMRKLLTATFLSLLLAAPAMAGGGGLDAFLQNVNIQARTDLNHFTAQVSAQFGVPEAQVRVVLGQVSQPADAFMVFQLGQMTGRPAPEVTQIYQDNRGRGWGVIAQRLGIRPGSREFHALKRGDLQFGPGADGGRMGPGAGGQADDDEGPGHGRGRGHRPF